MSRPLSYAAVILAAVTIAVGLLFPLIFNSFMLLHLRGIL